MQSHKNQGNYHTGNLYNRLIRGSLKLKKIIDIFKDDEIEYIDENMIGKIIYPIDIDKMIAIVII